MKRYVLMKDCMRGFSTLKKERLYLDWYTKVYTLHVPCVWVCVEIFCTFEAHTKMPTSNTLFEVFNFNTFFF